MLKLTLSSQFSMLSTSAARLRTVVLTWCRVFPVSVSCGSVLHIAQDSVLAFYSSVVCLLSVLKSTQEGSRWLGGVLDNNSTFSCTNLKMLPLLPHTPPDHSFLPGSPVSFQLPGLSALLILHVSNPGSQLLLVLSIGQRTPFQFCQKALPIQVLLDEGLPWFISGHCFSSKLCFKSFLRNKGSIYCSKATISQVWWCIKRKCSS